jgi:hypothetical protein
MTLGHKAKPTGQELPSGQPVTRFAPVGFSVISFTPVRFHLGRKAV